MGTYPTRLVASFVEKDRLHYPHISVSLRLHKNTFKFDRKESPLPTSEMSSLKDLLPAPTDNYHVPEEKEETVRPSMIAQQTVSHTSDPKTPTSNTISLYNKQADQLDYSAVVRQGVNATRKVHTRFDAMVEKPREEALQPFPTSKEISDVTRKTKAALENALSSKCVAPSKNQAKKPATFLRYTPANASGASTNPSQQRIIKMVEAPRDPMEPPRFSQRKALVNPPSPPVPVMHSPERKLGKEEAAAWNIPPVVSDWKNNRGYTISLDKRLAADGRQFIDRTINDRFAQMAEALYGAEKRAREEVEMRAGLQRQISIRAKAERERELRELAEKARKERKGYFETSVRTDNESVVAAESENTGREWSNTSREEKRVEDDEPPCLTNTAEQATGRVRRSRFSSRMEKGLEEDSAATQLEEARRERIRQERRLQRDRELRAREMNGDESGRQTLKRSKLSRDADRDLSEQIALGQNALGGASGEVMYDERLFNQDGASGLATGFGADDTYNLYEVGLFSGTNTASKMLRGRNEDGDRREGPSADKAAHNGNEPRRSRSRVEFERDDAVSNAEGDPYGLSKMLSHVGNARERQ